MSIVVSAATGQLGRLVVQSLLERGVPASEITATGRAIERLKPFVSRGVRVIASDYADPVSLGAALSDADVFVFISAGDVWAQRQSHRNVVEAAVRAKVGQVIYTSIPKADTTKMLISQEHRLVEEDLRASGLNWTILRNGWYVENYSSRIPAYLEQGIIGACGGGKVSLAARWDYADAAAVAATTEGHIGRVYELGGEALSMVDWAALVSEVTGQVVSYTDISEAELKAILVNGAGVPESIAAIFADVDTGIKAGDLYVDSGDLERLVGRPLVPVVDVIRQALTVQ